ncbi:4'-phosphopantetheinyl transferase superfamily protein [Sinomonas sp. JGH33]|uniref:4'-phosphopantetheinyl transferase superfamily protein n=1 Tax=Sinomonas terricola TaxID=3110330 RepID=A0ABU5T4C1_9MICC|nr:4'-phosphopantetheinyl transferase superfamily protein [Sinomonas sp. JGH33]MEA5454517.1 4'-phosphopantetheinyl transferase superfamily protein [Sinomonas sp. JGH33]
MMLRAVPLGHKGSPLPAGRPTEGEALRARAFADAQRGHEFLAGRIALRVLVGEALGVGPGRILPLYRCPACGDGEHGSPGFALAASDDGDAGDALSTRLLLAASMSRAAGWALLGLERSRECSAPARIGVDLAHASDFGTIPDSAFSSRECLRLTASRDAQAEAARLWARKEALLKAMGTGLRTDPASVETLGDPRVVDLDARALGLPDGFSAAAARL